MGCQQRGWDLAGFYFLVFLVFHWCHGMCQVEPHVYDESRRLSAATDRIFCFKAALSG